jgi:pimeloyl-ACP methyl ester carboxylesterase
LAAGWPDESGHALALGQTEPWLDSLGVVQTPTLVIHGDSDPLFAPDHAEALASEIPTAKLLMLEGLGHEIPPGLVDDVLPVLLEHLEGAE